MLGAVTQANQQTNKQINWNLTVNSTTPVKSLFLSTVAYGKDIVIHLGVMDNNKNDHFAQTILLHLYYIREFIIFL